MQRAYERKFIDCKALDVDTSKRQVKVAIAQVESEDRDDEVFDSKAFDKTLKEKGPSGSNEVWHLLDHTNKSFSALSKFKELYKEGQYIVGVSQYKDSFAWREVAWPLYESGDFTQHSVGFTTVNKSRGKNDKVTTITEVTLWEGSAVLWGANPNTPTLDVLKGLFDDELTEDQVTVARLERVIKRLKEDKFSDNNKSLLLIELLQLQNNIIDLTSQKSTKPEETPTLPEEVKVTDEINLFFNKSKH